MHELLLLINYSLGPYYTILCLQHPITLELYTMTQGKKAIFSTSGGYPAFKKLLHLSQALLPI